MEQTQQVLSTYLYIGKAEKGGCWQLFFFFLVALEFELRASHWLGRCSTIW
jgi:hypothetical protein